jgi:hypothetical protein
MAKRAIAMLLRYFRGWRHASQSNVLAMRGHHGRLPDAVALVATPGR